MMMADAPPVPPVVASAPAPVQITAESVDPMFNQPVIEVNELRSEPVPHRYVQGVFKGTGARFSFYFPPKERYQGRFFHNTYPLSTTSDIAPFPIQFDVAVGNLGFTIDSGAYYVQTNGGALRVNAAAAKFSRVVAQDLYGKHRPYGYLFGGSGGSYQVMGAAEGTSGIWDGFLPYVLGTPYATPSVFTVRLHPLRLLREGRKWPGVMDAIDPGGSGDPYAGLNAEERAALREATLFGFPPRSWWDHETMTGGYLAYVAPSVRRADPTYVDDFWSKPGYLGSDPSSSIRAARVQFETTVARVGEGRDRQIELASLPEKDFGDADLVILSGAAAGKTVTLGARSANPLTFGITADRSALASLRPGDRVRIDNSWALALQTYQRHVVPPASAGAYGWDQYRDASGKPIYPQRALPGQAAGAGVAGAPIQGRITAKTLVLEALMDIDALPWQADWYRSQVRTQLGSKFKDNFAIWYVDHAQHDNPLSVPAHARTVSYEGALQQGLRDLSRWVEKGIKPAETRYEVVDSQVRVPAGAAARGGIQPVVELKANGGVRTEVAVGAPVRFTATIEVPPNAGKVVAAEWDFEGVGNYPVAAPIAKPASRVRLSATHAFDRPGTYFAVLRATSQRQGDAKTPYGRVQNIARVRVVVGYSTGK